MQVADPAREQSPKHFSVIQIDARRGHSSSALGQIRKHGKGESQLRQGDLIRQVQLIRAIQRESPTIGEIMALSLFIDR
jgi:hypothetical protein